MADRRRILVVEDDTDLRGFYRTALTLGGFDVREAMDGIEALRSLDRDPPDLIVLDLTLPGMSGFAIHDEVSAQAHIRRIPIVVVTGMAGAQLDQLDVKCVLTKPVQADRLVETVRACLPRRRE